MNKIYQRLFIFFILIFMGCAHTKITSIKNPESPPQKYNKVMVMANPTISLSDRKCIETTMVKYIKEIGVFCESAIAIMPLKNYSSKEEFSQIAVEKGFNAVLFVDLSKIYYEDLNMPGSSSTYSNRMGSVTFYNAGQNVKLPRMDFQISLLEMNPTRPVWTSSTHTSGGASVTFEKMIDSLSAKTASKLKEDGII